MSNKSRTLFVGNIPYDATEDELRNIFARAGPVEHFRLVFDRDTKQPKGYGFCDFVSPETAQNAIRSLHDVEYSGRRLRLDLSDLPLRSALGAPASRVPGQLALPAPEGASQSLRAFPPPMPGGPAASLPLPLGMAPMKPLEPNLSAPACDPITARKLLLEAEAELSAHSQIAQAVAALPKAQLQLCLGSMQRLAQEAPEATRNMLLEHPQLCYALLHGQLLHGMTAEPSLPPGEAELAHLRQRAAAQPPPPMFSPCLGMMPGGVHPAMMRPLSLNGMRRGGKGEGRIVLPPSGGMAAAMHFRQPGGMPPQMVQGMQM